MKRQNRRSDRRPSLELPNPPRPIQPVRPPISAIGLEANSNADVSPRPVQPPEPHPYQPIPRQPVPRPTVNLSHLLSQLSRLNLGVARPSRFRLLMVWLLLMLSGCGLIVHLFQLQVLQASRLKEMAQSQRPRVSPFIPRRPIVDRHNNILAADEPTYTLYAHPKLFRLSYEDVAQQLAPILKRSESELVQKMRSASSGIRLAEFLDEATLREINQLENDGLEIETRTIRRYPRQDSGAEVIGYVNFDGEAGAGVESSQKKAIERLQDQQHPNQAETGLIDRSAHPFVPIDDLQLKLTIDTRLQRLIRPILENQVGHFGARRGLVIIMDAWDGSILALVSTPSFNPNEYFKADLSSLKNWAVTDLYEPGSTFKPVNMAIALQSGKVTQNDYFYDPGQLIIDGWPISNAGGVGYGSIGLNDIMRNSSNIGMVQMMRQLKPEIYYDWIAKLGMGDITHTDLPFEVPSQIKSREQFLSSPVEAATTAFGQGFAITPIQMLRLQGTLANGGKLVTPHVVQGLYDSQGKSHWQPDIPPPKQVFSPEHVKTVLEAMEGVVESGTGTLAHIPNYRIAGKTGTAQKSTGSGGYSSSAIITSFVGIMPIENPRYVVLAIVDEPRGGSGGEVAAPIVKSVLELLIGIEGIPPSE
jgi:cell division protein FtsI (penicillin-binding protein 3)